MGRGVLAARGFAQKVVLGEREAAARYFEAYGCAMLGSWGRERRERGGASGIRWAAQRVCALGCSVLLTIDIAIAMKMLNTSN